MLRLTQRLLSGSSFKLVSVPSIPLPKFLEDFLSSWHGSMPLDFLVLCLKGGKDVTHLSIYKHGIIQPISWNRSYILAHIQSLFCTVWLILSRDDSRPRPMYLFIWLSVWTLYNTLYNQLVHISKCLHLWAALANEPNLRKVLWAPPIYSWLVRSAGDRQPRLVIGAWIRGRYCGTELLTCVRSDTISSWIIPDLCIFLCRKQLVSTENWRTAWWHWNTHLSHHVLCLVPSVIKWIVSSALSTQHSFLNGHMLSTKLVFF